MMWLAYALSKLRPRPGMPDDLLYSYPLGIERLRSTGGDVAMESLCEVVQDLKFRPDFQFRHRQVSVPLKFGPRPS